MPASLPALVGLLGRPNVGKSTLFNKLTRSRRAIVKDQPGVTRDVNIEETEWWGTTFRIADMGGLTDDKQGFSPYIKERVLSFLESVDALIVIFDGKSGLLPEDRDIFRIAQATGKPFVCVVNKVDRFQTADETLAEFYEFGNDLISAAFEKDYNTDEVVEWVLANLPENHSLLREGLRLTIVGKPNAGKSSLANCLLAEDRMLVSPIAGTTVDAVEEQFEFDGEKFILVDTAGLRRGAKQEEGVEVLSGFKSRNAIDRSNLVLLVVDGVLGLSHQDARILEYCVDRHKAIIMVVNKYDLTKKEREDFRTYFQEHLERKFHFFPDVPYVHVSAKTGYGVRTLMQKIFEVKLKMRTKISTSKLNKFFSEVIKQAPAPVYRSNDVKFYYLTQTGQSPPSFIAFANHPEGVTATYRRFLVRKLQEEFGMEGIPLRIFILPKGGGGKRSKASHLVEAQLQDDAYREYMDHATD
jgi:GTPase